MSKNYFKIIVRKYKFSSLNISVDQVVMLLELI